MIKAEIERAALHWVSQEKWVKLKLMQRSAKVPLVIAPRRVDQGPDWPDKVGRRLDLDSGFLVSRSELEPIFHGYYLEDEDVSTHLWRALYSLRKRSNQPVFTAPDIGVGTRIRRLDLTYWEACGLYFLRSHEGERMSGKEIGIELFDGKGNDQRAPTVRRIIGGLRAKPAHGKTYEITTHGRWDNKGYEYNELQRIKR